MPNRRCGFSLSRNHAQVFMPCGGGAYSPAVVSAPLVTGKHLKDSAYLLFGRSEKGGRDEFEQELRDMKGLAATVNTLLTEIVLNNNWDKYKGQIQTLGLVSGDDPTQNYVQIPMDTTQWADGFTQDNYKSLVADMIFGQWKPWRIALAALLFGLFRALSNVYAGFDFLVALNIPGSVYNMTINLGHSFRHIAVQKGADIKGIKLIPPHDHLGEVIGPLLPSGCPNADVLKALMKKAHEILDHHPLNEKLRAAGRMPANGIWFWAEGSAAAMRLESDTQHPHGLSDSDYDSLFTRDKTIIFAFHGYPSLIHKLTYKRFNKSIHEVLLDFSLTLI